jgi:superfamily II DNA or RNA helicase
MSDSESESSRASVQVPNDVEIDSSKGEIVEDITGRGDFLNDESSSATLNLSDGTPSIKPRAYQTEMLEESLKHNIIVAAGTGSGKTRVQAFFFF